MQFLTICIQESAKVINVLDSQEAKPYKDDPEIVALTDLVDAYQVISYTYNILYY